MPRMVRKQVYIEREQDESLKRLARETGATEAEIVREALDRQTAVVVVRQRDLRAWREECAFIRRLIRKGRVPGGRRWRREDLHER